MDHLSISHIKAIEENLTATWANFSLGGEFHRNKEIVRIASLIPYIPYNGIFYTNWQNLDIDMRIQTHIDYFKSRNAQMIWAVGPSTQPSNLAEHLLARGFVMVQELVGMAIELENLPGQVNLPPVTEIREVEDDQSLRQFVDLVAWKWDLPPESNELFFKINKQLGMGADKPARRWLAYQNGIPVAKATTYTGAGVVGIYGVSTVPEARRQGLGKAITQQALLSALQAGNKIGVLHSTEMGLSTYRKLGFQEYCRIHMYALV